MAKLYDIVVFGATGFTGQFVVDEVARIADKEPGLKWAIAGRRMEQLQKVYEEASKRTGFRLENLPILLADVSNEQSLLDMCSQTKVLLNCVGPYKLYGEPVVKACIEKGSSHIDISGEPLFLEKIQLFYNDKAKEAGVYVVGTCGFDSIPADMGVIFTEQKFPGDLNSVESFVEITGGPSGRAFNFGTFESAVYIVANSGEMPVLRKSLYPSPLPKPKHSHPKRIPVFFSKEVNKWCVLFPGTDKSVVYRTQRYNLELKKKRPVQFAQYFCLPSLLATIGLILFAAFFAVMATFSFTRKLLLKYPSFFTGGTFKKGGPSKKQIEEAAFTMTFVGKGYRTKLSDPDASRADRDLPDETITTRITGPEAGYVTTPICMVQAALVLLKERDKLPAVGGVFTPGALFADTSLISGLEQRNIKFQVISAAK